ncbi:hypothetical protein J6590_054454 [Homalodisca vitripennis]|nr:hypothetical protein J6590_054454 [Homalodisca vitripennis]
MAVTTNGGVTNLLNHVANYGACNLVCATDGSELRYTASKCDSIFHANCVKDSLDETKTRSQLQTWKCKKCKESTTSKKGNTTIPNGGITKDFLTQALNNLQTQVFNALAKSSSEMIKWTQSHSLMLKLNKEFAEIKKENAELRAENTKLKSEVKDLKESVRSLEQYSRRCNVEISGIPVTPNEDATTIYGVALVEDADIAAAHRIPSFKRDRPSSLIVQFLKKNVKDTWLSKARVIKPLTADKVNNAFPRQTVY